MIKKATPTSKKPSKLKQQPTSTKPKAPPTPRVKRQPDSFEKNVEAVCGLIDPFCEHARGSKYPDQSSARTLPYSVQFNTVFSTDANGYLSFVFDPRISSDGSGMVNVATVAAGVATSALNWTGAKVPILTGASQYRVVSAGLRIKNIAPMLTTSGMVHIRSYGDPDCSKLAVYNIDTYSASKVVNVPLIEAKDVTVISEHSSQMPQLFYLPGVNPFSNFTGAGFNPVSVAISGGPATANVLFVDFIIHIEYLFIDSEPLALAATPAPVYNQVVHAVTQKVSSEATNFFGKSVEYISRSIKSRASDYLANLLLRAPNPVAKAAGGALTYIREVD